ncbi:MAG TPA: hypothetical protein VEI27_01810 [Dehalococcoidales bacterium]|nr:hypothetical protein [Dehalococcoidales bacterium]
MNRVKAFFIVIGGLIIFVLGFGMWRSPEINWDGFLNSWVLIGDEFTRLKDDPFAILGILIIIVGVFITYQGIKRLVKRNN